MKEEVSDYAMFSNMCAPSAANYAPMMQQIAPHEMAYGGYAGNAPMSRTTANYARGGASYNYNQTTSLASLLYLNPNQYFSFQNFL